MREKRVPLELFDHRSDTVVPADTEIVALGHIVGEHHTRTRSQARQHRQQDIALQRLRLVDDHKRVVQRTTPNMGQGKNFQHATTEDLLDHLRGREPLQGVEHGLRPGPHLLGLTAREIAEVLSTNGIQRPKDDHLALGSPLEHRFETCAQGQSRLAGAGLAAHRHDAHAVVEQQIKGNTLLRTATTQPEHLTFTPDQLHLLLRVDPTQGAGIRSQQTDSGMAGQISGRIDIHDAVGEKCVDHRRIDVQFGHTRPTGRHHVLSVILVGSQTHRSGLDPQRGVLGHQRHILALGAKVQRASQDSRIIGVGAEARRQDCRIGVVELYLDGATEIPDRDLLIEPAVLEAEVVEHPQRLAGEPAQFMMMAFALEFTDDHQRQDHVVFGESCYRPRVGQQHRGVEDIGTSIACGHEGLLRRSGTTSTGVAGPVGSGRCGRVATSTRTGAGPLALTQASQRSNLPDEPLPRGPSLVKVRRVRRVGSSETTRVRE